MKGQLAREEELGMAKQGKLLPARRQRDQTQDVDSILFRSAESIGRLIGTLQRQLDSARNEIANFSNNGNSGSRTDQNVRGKHTRSMPKAKASVAVKRAGKTNGKKRAAKSTAARSTRPSSAGKRKDTSSRTLKAKKARKPR